MAGKIVKSGFTRAWIILNGVSPKNMPEYFGHLKVEDPSRSYGSITTIEIPDPARYNNFIEIDSIAGAIERASFGLTGRYPIDKSRLLELARLGCRIDVQVHVGNCKDPRDYDNNWDKIIIFGDGRIEEYSIEGISAIDSSERAAANESVSLTASTFYEVNRLMFNEIEALNVTTTIRDVSIYGVLGCDDCSESELFRGCSTIFSVQDGNGALIPPTIIFSNDDFASSGTDVNTVLAGTDTISDATFVGTFYVMLSETATGGTGNISWITIDEALQGIAGWDTPTVNPFVPPLTTPAKTPVALDSYSPRDTIIVGRGGAIWKMIGIGDVRLLEAPGAVTPEDLLAVHMFDNDKIIIGGANNTLLFTIEGGGLWSIATMPTAEAGNDITAVYMLTEFTWLVGYDTSGNVYCTNNGGVSWSQVSLPLSTTKINDFHFSTDAVGVMAVLTPSGGTVLRTTNGGYSWRVMPDGIGAFPTNTELYSIAMCEDEPNVVYTGGSGATPPDGILIKGVNP